jgi:hypothetical protein
MNYGELENFELIAEVLNISVELVKEWSDGSCTIGDKTNYEYIVTSEEANCYMEFIGKYGDRYIYKN